MVDKDILFYICLVKKDREIGKLKLKYVVFILFGKEEVIEEYMFCYCFEVLFYMCIYEEYNDIKCFFNWYDDCIMMCCNLIKVYD